MKYLLIPLSILFIFTSCVDEIKKNIPSILPSYGISLLLVDDGRPLSAVVFASGPVDGQVPLEMIRNAKVFVWENDNLVDSLSYNEQTRHFEGKTKPIAGNKYYCKAYFSDSTVLYAQTELPEITPILKWEVLPNIGETSDANIYSRLNFTIPVKKDKTYFYELVLRYSRLSDSDTLSYPSVFETEKACRAIQIADIVDPVLKHEDVIDKILFSTSLMHGNTYDMQVNFFTTNEIDGLYIILRSVSEEYYRFARSIDRYEESRFPNILENPIAYTIYTNVENGKGVFCGYSVQQIGPIRGLNFR
ncbi:MAG: DUF4249 family protein [Bacteroidales bacterium]